MSEWKLEQHIFTSRISFETVAMSTGITPAIRASLEAHARYPHLRTWNTTGKDSPPFVFRAFPLSEGTHAVSLLQYIGPSTTRSEGNYLAHSYVIPDPLLREMNYNLPWIAANLLIEWGYRPQKASGADILEPRSFSIDTFEPFR